MLHQLFASLRVRLLLLVVLAVIPALVLILYNTAEQRKLAAEAVQADALWLTRLVAADQKRLVNDTRQLLLTLAHLEEVRVEDEAACSAFLSRLANQYPQYANLGVINADGQVICAANLEDQPWISGQNFYTQAIRERQFTISEFHEPPANQNAAIYFAFPVVDDENKSSSAVFAALSLGWLNRVVVETQLPEDATLILVDVDGTVLIHYPEPEKWVGRKLIQAPLLDAILQQGEGTQAVQGLDGVDRLYAFTPIGSFSPNRFYVGIGISESAAFAQANRNLNRHLIGLAVVAIFALVSAWFAGDVFFIRRLNMLLSATQKVASGDLNARTGMAYGLGELNELAQAFDQMAESLQARDRERRQTQQEILRQNRELSTLNSITAAVSSSLELPEVLDGLKTLLASQLTIPGGIIYFFDPSSERLSVQGAWGVPAAVLAEFKQFSAHRLHYAQVVTQRETILRPDMRAVEPFASLGLHTLRPQWQAYLSAPLIARGEIQGILDVFSQQPEVFTQDDADLFTTLGQQVGVAIQNARLFEQVRSSHNRLQILSKQLLQIQETERRHISRELHDQVGQALTAVKVNLQAAMHPSSVELTTERLDECSSILEHALQQVRSLSLDLRPSLLDDLGVAAALRWYVDKQAQRAGFDAQIYSDLNEGRLPAEIETTCFRVVQEAITNVIRHANASQVEVSLRKRAGHIELLICDNGAGFDVTNVMEGSKDDSSLGLIGMEERIQLVGGRLELKSSPGTGTQVLALIPLDGNPRAGGKAE